MATEKDTRTLHQRLLAAVDECPPIAKDTTVGEGRFSYKATTYDGAIKEIKPILVKHGIVTSSRIVSFEHTQYDYTTGQGQEKTGFITYAHVEVDFINADDPTDRETFSGLGMGMDSQDKGPGKAITYARKTAILAALMTTTGDNEEDRPDHTPTRSMPAQRRTEPSAAKYATDHAVRTLNIKGKAVYGDVWEEVKKNVLGKMGLTSTKELSPTDCDGWTRTLIKKEEEKAQAEMFGNDPENHGLTGGEMSTDAG